MKLIGHIVKKDLRRFWFGIVILVGIVALKFFLADVVYYLDMPPRDWNFRLQRYQFFLLFAQLAVSFALAVGIVQEDSVPDAGALCQTLPITRAQLLGAKLLSIVSICVLPVILMISVGWVLLGLPAGQLGWPLAVFSAAELGLGLVALAFGSLTKNAGQLLLWMLGVLLAFVFPAMIIEPILHREPMITPGTRLTGIALVYFVWITGSLAVTLNQYLSRSRTRSIVFLGAGVFLSFFLFEAGHTRFFLDLASTRFSAQRELDAQIARLEVHLGQADVGRPQPEAEDPLVAVLLHMSIDEPSRGQLISIRGFYGQWSQMGPIPYRLYLPRSDYLNDLKRTAEYELGFRGHKETDQIQFGAETRFGGPGPHPWDSGRAPFEGQIDLGVYQFRVEGELPLTKGASLRSTVGTTRIRGVAFDGSVITVDLEGRASAMGVDPGWFPGLDALFSPVAHWNGVLVNRKSKTVLTPSIRYSVTLSSYAYGADLAHAQIAYVLPKGQADGGLTDWVLVEVSMGDLHRSIRSFQTNVSFHEGITRDHAWFQ